ncbi:acyltransferase [Thiomicrorhabdus sp.]|uniref:acyltransferase family protein n=1 Tax=Thiomicrorhabdus sp. TaxID=2039724 RepID=UPI0029C68DD9|nr:acyltransferase [Thiomicrorhabdus sp.]
MIYSIQYMRAIAAILVLLSHIGMKSVQNSTGVLGWFQGFGGIGVDLFFIISGFIMAYITQVKETTLPSFFKARFIRILPLYWFLTTAALIVYLFFPGLVNSSGGETSIVCSYLLIPSEYKYLVNNGWTLSYEFYFYFLFALAMFASYQYRNAIAATILLILVILGIIYDHQAFLLSDFLLEFLFGIFVFCVFFKNEFIKGYFYSSLFLIISAALFFLLDTNIRAIDNGFPMLFLFISILLLEAIFINNQGNVFLKFFERIGDSSYSLYLIHPFVLSLCALVFGKVFPIEYPWIYAFFLFGISLLGGYWCYVFIEKKLNKLARRLL